MSTTITTKEHWAEGTTWKLLYICPGGIGGFTILCILYTNQKAPLWTIKTCSTFYRSIQQCISRSNI